MPSQPSIRCRQIGPADLSAIADLLARGFPGRSRAYWSRGLDIMAERDVPGGLPRFGYMLETGGAAVGAILLIVSALPDDSGVPALRCNLSSWYVDPAFRSHAALLAGVPLKFKQVTHLNISAAPNTWATIEAQGFARYTAGQLLAVPALARSAPGLRVQPFAAGDTVLAEADRLADQTVLADHAALGCTCLVGRSPEGLHPFAFLPVRVRRGRIPVPAMQLVYSRSVDDVVRFAGPIGRHLLGRGIPLLLLDAPGPLAGLPGVFLKDRARKYFKGPDRPRLGDLAYTEFVLFGP